MLVGLWGGPPPCGRSSTTGELIMPSFVSVYWPTLLFQVMEITGKIVAMSSQCEGLKPPLESFSWIDHAVIVMSNNY